MINKRRLGITMLRMRRLTRRVGIAWAEIMDLRVLSVPICICNRVLYFISFVPAVSEIGLGRTAEGLKMLPHF